MPRSSQPEARTRRNCCYQQRCTSKVVRSVATTPEQVAEDKEASLRRSFHFHSRYYPRLSVIDNRIEDS